MKTSLFSDNLAKRARPETGARSDLSQANALIAQEINFFDKCRVRSLGGQLAEKAAEAAVRRLTPQPSERAWPEKTATSLSTTPVAPLTQPTREASLAPQAQPIEVTGPPVPQAERLDKEEIADPSWLKSVKWLTRLFMSLFFLVWVFVLGVLVGRGSLWDYPGSPPLNPVAPAGQPPKAIVEKTPAPSLEPPLLATALPAQASVAQASVAQLPLAQTPAPHTPTPQSSAPALVKPHLAAPISPEPAQPEPVRTPAPAAPTPSVDSDQEKFWPDKPQAQGLFTVQIAAAKSAEEARQIVTRFQKLNFEAYFYEKRPGLFPVRVGRYQTQQEAEAAKKRLALVGARLPYVSRLNR
ncbi:MAG: SPOR domain-containing protein [Deltaproteobacteria bacterium]|nr:SPOR domain-containing protein [Deltaproteobacteria bacterium]